MLLQIPVCWHNHQSGIFQDFQYAYYASFTQQPVGGLASGFFYVGYAIFWGFSGHFSCCFEHINFTFRQDGSHCGPRVSSVCPNFRSGILHRQPHCPFFPVWLFPLFPALFAALPWMLPARFPQLQVHSDCCLFLRVYLHRCFYHPRLLLLLGPPGLVDRSSDYLRPMCFPVFSSHSEVWTESGDRRLCLD